jgi:hypothetical protein
LYPRGQNQQEEGNKEHPLSIEGDVPLFRSPDAGQFYEKTCKPKPFGLLLSLKGKRMAKSYKGQIPDASEGWRIAGTVDHDGEWIVFKKRQEHSPEWVTYKIVANGKAINKANYWLARNEITGQIGFARDFVLLREHRPKIHKYVEDIIFRKNG